MSTRTSSEGASPIGYSPPVDDETPDEEGAFPRLTDDQVAKLEVGGSRRPVHAGEVLIREGAPDNDFVVVLSGKIAVVDEGDADGERRILRVHGPGRFLGELGLLEGQVAFFTAEAIEDGEILVVPAEQVRELIAHDPVLSDLILRAYLVRRHLLIGLGSGFRIIGSCFSPDTLRLREFAMRNRLPHKWFDLEQDERVEQLLRSLNVAPEDTPVVIWHGEKVLRNPTNAELARVVGLPVPAPVADAAKDVYNLVVVGAGPAGLAASVYGASDGLNTVTLERIAAGGQASTSSRIENYLGFPAGVSGSELAERAVLQAGKFGARILVSAEVTGLGSEAGNHVLRLADGGSVHARAVVLAAGARYRCTCSSAAMTSGRACPDTWSTRSNTIRGSPCTGTPRFVRSTARNTSKQLRSRTIAPATRTRFGCAPCSSSSGRYRTPGGLPTRSHSTTTASSSPVWTRSTHERTAACQSTAACPGRSKPACPDFSASATSEAGA